MSDNESSIQVTEKKKAKRVVSEAHREKLKANLEAARVARVAKIAERRAGRNEDELALKELIAEKKRTKIFGIQDDEPELPVAPQKIKSKKEKVVESSESDQSEPDDESEDDDEESEEEDAESASDSSESSDDEAEFVLKRKKAAPKKPSSVKMPKVKAAPVKKEKKAEKETILAEMARMTAEIAALKKEKRKQSKVNVYVNQPEKKEMSAKQRKDLLDL